MIGQALYMTYGRAFVDVKKNMALGDLKQKNEKNLLNRITLN